MARAIDLDAPAVQRSQITCGRIRDGQCPVTVSTGSIECSQGLSRCYFCIVPGIDVIITDQTMPEMTGATLVEELRRIRSDIPIILCTGFSHLINDEKAEALGIDAFVMKPGITQELAVTIQQVLAKRAQQEM